MRKDTLGKWALTGIALAATSAIVKADNDRWHNWYLAPQGVAIFESSARQVQRAGGVNVALGYKLSRHFDIEANGFYTDYRNDDDGHDYNSGLGVDGLFVFNRGGRVEPHLSLGFGGDYLDTRDKDVVSPFVSAGAGVRIPIIQDGLKLRFDAKYVYDFTGTSERSAKLPF